jgi:hypothetical protein
MEIAEMGEGCESKFVDTFIVGPQNFAELPTITLLDQPTSLVDKTTIQTPLVEIDLRAISPQKLPDSKDPNNPTILTIEIGREPQKSEEHPILINVAQKNDGEESRSISRQHATIRVLDYHVEGEEGVFAAILQDHSKYGTTVYRPKDATGNFIDKFQTNGQAVKSNEDPIFLQNGDVIGVGYEGKQHYLCVYIDQRGTMRLGRINSLYYDFKKSHNRICNEKVEVKL